MTKAESGREQHDQPRAVRVEDDDKEAKERSVRRVSCDCLPRMLVELLPLDRDEVLLIERSEG